MSDHDVFVVTENHLKLIRRLQFHFDNQAYRGAPVVDIKRPYGNRDVEGDVIEIIGPCNPHPMEMHQQTATVLQIVMDTGQFTPGEYRRYPGHPWMSTETLVAALRAIEKAQEDHKRRKEGGTL